MFQVRATFGDGEVKETQFGTLDDAQAFASTGVSNTLLGFEQKGIHVDCETETDEFGTDRIVLLIGFDELVVYEVGTGRNGFTQLH